jgi:translation elongation factor EF-G
MAKVITSLDLKLPHTDLMLKTPAERLQSVMTKWLPLATCVLDSILRTIPSPRVGQRERSSILFDIKQECQTAVLTCDSAADTVAYVVKQ